jgi:hypothetical protein
MNTKATFCRLINSSRHLSTSEKAEHIMRFNSLKTAEDQERALTDFRRSIPQDKSFQTKVAKGPHTA